MPKLEEALVALKLSSGNPLYELLVQFVGADRATVSKWCRGKQLPISTNLLKLWYFLDMAGVEFDEMQNLKQKSPQVFLFNQLLVFNLVDFRQLAESFQLTDSSLWRIIFAKAGTSDQSAEKVQYWLDLHQRECWAAWQDWQGEIAIIQSQGGYVASPVIDSGPTVSDVQTTDTLSHNERQALIASTAHLIQGLLPLAELLTSDQFTDADRQALRQQAGSNRVFDLKNALAGLCGERARQKMKESSVSSGLTGSGLISS